MTARFSYVYELSSSTAEQFISCANMSKHMNCKIARSELTTLAKLGIIRQNRRPRRMLGFE
jgi:hypothetical protein